MHSTDRPSWVADAIFYQIFPDRFARSERVPKPANLEAWSAPPSVHGYKGGDLLGVAEHLDWLMDLGVDAIYLNPIFQSASNHRYHPHDYFTVDPLLGGAAAFRELLDACHSRDIRLVLDGVFNHASRGFFRFNDILESGPDSPWVDWFTVHRFPVEAYHRSHRPRYDAWWGLPGLPKFNTENPAAREYLMTVAEHWVREGIDGWRLDVPEEIRTEGFWEELHTRVKAINPEAYLVGEIWRPAPEWVDGRFDGVMDYPMMAANLRFAAGGRIDAEVASTIPLVLDPPLDAAGYAAAVASHLAAYEESTENLGLLGSHDTPRVLTLVSHDSRTVRLAATLLFTFPGAPCVYYGDEIGMQGGHDPGCRAGLPWDEPDTWDREVLATFRELARLRRDHPALRRGAYDTVGASGSGYAFTRSREGESLLIAVNAGEGPTEIDTGLETTDRLWGAGASTGTVVGVPGRSAGIWRTA